MQDTIISALAGQYATFLWLGVNEDGEAVVVVERPAIVGWAVADSYALNPITPAVRATDACTMLLVTDGDGRLRDTDSGTLYADIAGAEAAFRCSAVEWAEERGHVAKAA